MGAADPIPLKVLKGRRPGKDSGGRTIKTAPKFKRVAPEPPSWLSREAKAEWRRVAPELTRLDLVKAEDRAALATYCETWSQFVEATRYVHEHGLTFEARQGTIARPEVAIARTAGRELRAWCKEFGLTPAAENSLAFEEPDGGDGDAFD